MAVRKDAPRASRKKAGFPIRKPHLPRYFDLVFLVLPAPVRRFGPRRPRPSASAAGSAWRPFAFLAGFGLGGLGGLGFFRLAGLCFSRLGAGLCLLWASFASVAGLVALLGAGLGLFLERRAEDIAERRAAVGRAVLRDRLFFVGDLDRLDRERRLLEPSNPLTLASILSPTGKRSARCSSRSRPSSVRLMKPIAPSSPTCTSRPAVLDRADVDGDRLALLRARTGAPPEAPAPAPAPPPSSCFMPRLMRSFSTSTSRTCALTISPLW